MSSKRWKRTSNRLSWTSENMGLAIKDVDDGISIRQAAKSRNVPRATLQRRINGINSVAVGDKKVRCYFGLSYNINLMTKLY